MARATSVRLDPGLIRRFDGASVALCYPAHGTSATANSEEAVGLDRRLLVAGCKREISSRWMVVSAPVSTGRLGHQRFLAMFVSAELRPAKPVATLDSLRNDDIRRRLDGALTEMNLQLHHVVPTSPARRVCGSAGARPLRRLPREGICSLDRLRTSVAPVIAQAREHLGVTARSARRCRADIEGESPT